ncbi:MAG: cyanophycin synthetase, partial [Myxococcota bacterium]|nr:cyanophycin synthetase [Myxococcota bacterium]
MRLLKVLALDGPNIWSRRSVLEAWVDLESLFDVSSTAIPGLYDRLCALVPSLVEHRCSVGEKGGFLQRLREGTYPAHILEHLTLELQSLAGTPVGFGKARETSTPGVYRIVVRYRNEGVARACLDKALELFSCAVEDRPFDMEGTLRQLKELTDDIFLGPSTLSIVEAAEARGIPHRRLNDGSLVLLGQGFRQRRIWTAETDTTSAIAESIAQDKELTKRLIKDCGVPVPSGRKVNSAEDAWEAATDIGLPVVVKPQDGNHGRGVCTNLLDQEDVERAFAVANAEGGGVLVERFVRGYEHRVLVVGGKVVAASRGESAWVTGDGVSTVAKLVESQLNADPRRGYSDEFPLNPVELDPVAILELSRQGESRDSVPPQGHKVLIQRNGNLAFDVTDDLHPSVVEHAVLAARVVGLDVAGIDIIAEDISAPLESQGGAVVEVNAGPALHMHLMPAVGKKRPVGEAVIESLFDQGEDGRIPVVSVGGTNGRSFVARLIAYYLRKRGRFTALACADGFFLGPRLVRGGNRADAESMRCALLSPKVEAAVFEVDSLKVLQEGLGFDRCAVAVVTGIAPDERLRAHFVETPSDQYTVERCGVDVVLPGGMAVLNADDPLVLEMAGLCAGGVVLVSTDPDNPAIAAHGAQGKRAVT